MDISFFAGRHREVPLRGPARHGRDASHAERRATAAHAGCAEASEDEALAGGEAAAVDGKAFGVQPGAWRAGAGAREGLGAGEEGEGAGEPGPWARHAQERAWGRVYGIFGGVWRWKRRWSWCGPPLERSTS